MSTALARHYYMPLRRGSDSLVDPSAELHSSWNLPKQFLSRTESRSPVDLESLGLAVHPVLCSVAEGGVSPAVAVLPASCVCPRLSAEAVAPVPASAIPRLVFLELFLP